MYTFISVVYFLYVCSVTQMVVDQVCVVKRSDNSSCVNQDVLFLGTCKFTTHSIYLYREWVCVHSIVYMKDIFDLAGIQTQD